MNFISELIEVHIFREADKGIEFLLLKRASQMIYPGLWQMVSGKIEGDEPAYKTALREIKEETCIVPEKFWVAPNINSFYDQKSDAISFLPVFAAKVAADSKVVLSEEHSEFQWTSPDKAKELLAWPGQKKSVDVITEYFTDESEFSKFIEIML